MSSALFSALLPTSTQAATSSTLTFQARLLSNTGALVADGTYNMQFNLYTVSSGGTTQWTESRLVNATQGVTLKSGYFSVDLGSITSFPTTIDWSEEQWLGMTVRGTNSCTPFSSCATPADAEMTPRFKLTAVPYAFSAGQLEKRSGANLLRVQTATPTANITYTFQDAAAGTYNVCTSANNCTSLGSYIQNQNASDQTANFRITGTGRANTSFTSPAFDSITGAVTLGGTTATGVTLGNTTNTASFTLQGTVAATYTIGTATGTGIITVGQSTAAQTINIASANATTGVQAVNIANGTTGANTTVSILSGVGTAGAGTLNLGNNTRVTTIGIGNIAPAAARTITIGGGNSGVVDALNIGTGATTVAGGKTINIGSTAPTGAGTNLITIGSTTNASTLTLQGGTGATAIQLQTATGAGINIGTTNNSQTITIGNTGGATSTNLYAASGITIDGIGATTYNIAGSITTGSVTVGATLQTGLLTLGRSTATNTISIGSAVTSATNTQTVNIANGAGAGTATNVNILSGSGTAGTGTLTLGNNPRVTQIDLGNVSASAARTINIASSNSAGTDTLNIATGNLSSTFNKVVNIANGNPSSSGVNQVTIGSIAAGGNTTTIQGGNGGTALRLMTAASGTLSVGNNGVASTIQVGNTTGAVTQTINIGNNATASSTTNITIGSTIAGTTTLQGLASLTGAVLQGTNTTGLTFEGTTADAFETTFAVVDPTVGDQIYQLPNAAAAGTYQICTTANNCTSLGSYIQNSTAAQNTANFNIQSTGTTNVTAKIRANTSQTADLLQLRDSTDTTTLLAVQADGDLEVDTNTLFVDATNNRVSIGTTSNTFVSAQFGTSNSSLHVSNGAASEANLTLVTNENTQEYFNSQLNFVRSRGTSGTPTVVQNGDDVGALYFYGYDGDTYERLAGILIEADAASGLGDTPGRITLQTTPDGAQLPVDRLVVQNDGDIAVDTNTLFVDATNNRVGIGNAIPTSTLYVEKFGTSDTFITNIQSSSASTSTQTTLNVANAASPGSASTAIYYGGKINIASSSANLTGGGIIGLENQAAFSATGSILYSYGADSYSYNASTGTINNAFGLQSRIYNQTTGSIGTAYASNSFVQNASTGVITTANGYHTKLINAGTVTTSYGLEVENPQNTGTIGTARGVALGDLSAATGTITNRTNLLIGTGTTGNWSIYNNSSYNNYFQGNLRIGTTGTPNAPIDIVAAAATSIRVTAGASWPLILQQDTASNFTISNDNTVRVTVAQGGNVGIGQLTPGAKLDVSALSGTGVALRVNSGTSTGNILEVQDNGTNVLTVADGGGVGIGAAPTTTARLYVRRDIADWSGTQYGVDNYLSINSTALTASGANASRNWLNVSNTSTVAYTSTLRAEYNYVRNQGSGNVGVLVGTESFVDHAGGGTATSVYGVTSDVASTGASTTTNSNAYRASIFTANTGVITNGRGFFFDGATEFDTSSITNAAGLNISNITAATNNTLVLLGQQTNAAGNWSIYNSSTYDNYFGGNLYLAAGSTSATQLEVRDANSATVTLLVADSTNDRIYVGDTTADATGTLLVLDTKNTAGDPTGATGGMYYNSNTYTFRCYTTAWVDCQGSGASKWTDAGSYTYLTASTDRLIVGSTSDVSTTKLAVISTNSANNVSTFNTQASLTTTTASTRTFNTWLNTDIAPASAVGTNTNYSVLHLWTGVNSAGRLDTTTDIRKIDLYTEYNSSSAETIASATNIYTSDVVNTNFTITNFKGVLLNDPGGAGTITSNTALNIANQTKGTNNSNLLIGTTTIPSGNYSIYNSSNYTNLIQGSVVANNSATGTTRTTEATARTNVTTVTTTVAGFSNNDIIFINNAGQDYYTRITAGGGTTTLTVSPAVSYDASATVTLYQNVANIGATSTDYTTQTNRFFQGYFLGGVVTGAGSTTLSDGALNSTGNLTLQSTSGNVGIGTGSTAPATKLEVSGTATNVGITVDAPTGYYAMQYFAENGTNKWHYEVAPTSFGGYFSFVESGVAERMRIATGGNIGIGTTGTPSQLLSVGGTTGNLTVSTTGAVVSASTIRSNSGFNFNGTAGASTTCTGGQILQNQVVSGGIVTGGTCSSAGTGTVTGTGANTQLAFWTSGSALGGNANFVFDTANTRLAVGTATTTDAALTITGGGSTGWTTGGWNKTLKVGTDGSHATIRFPFNASTQFGLGVTTDGIFRVIKSTATDNSAAATYPLTIDTSGNTALSGTVFGSASIQAVTGMALGSGSSISATHLAQNSIQVETDTYYGGVHNAHSGALIYSAGMNGWGTAQFNVAISNNWGTYNTTTPALNLGQTLTTFSGGVRSVYSATNTPRWDTAFYVLQSQHWYSHNATDLMYIGESTNTASVRGDLVLGGTTAIGGSEPLELQGSGAGISLYDRTTGATDRWVIYANSQLLNFWKGANALTVDGGGSIYSGGNFFYNGNIWNDAQTTVATNNGTVCWDPGNPFGGADSHDQYARCSSIRALKTNIADLPYGLATIRQLQPRQFNWISSGLQDFGFIADEVEAIHPMFAEYDGSGALTGVHYLHMSALMAQGIKELDVQVQSIDARLTVLESGQFAGNLTVQGDTTVQKLTVNGKIITGGSAPAVVSGTASGTGASLAATVIGNDTAGTVSFTTGTTGLVANDLLGEITFTTPYTQPPIVTVSPTTEDAASIRYFVLKTVAGWSIKVLDAPQAGKTYSFDYHVIQ